MKAESRKRKTSVARALLLLFPLGGTTAHSAPTGKPQDPCSMALPRNVASNLKALFPEWSIVHQRLLRPDDRRQFASQNPGKCAGVARGDFFGDGTDAFAILLTRFRGDRRLILIAVARILTPDAGPWVQIVDGYDTNRLDVPLLIVGEAGEYENVYGDDKLTARFPVFHLIHPEASETVFIWTGHYFGKIWLSD